MSAKKRKPPETTSELLDVLTDFLSETSEEEDLAQIRQELREAGINADEVVSNMVNMVHDRLAEHKLAKARRQRLLTLHKMKQRGEISDQATDLKTVIMERIRSLAHGNQQLAQAYFRKFDNATEEDLKSLLEDLDKLEHWGDE